MRGSGTGDAAPNGDADVTAASTVRGLAEAESRAPAVGGADSVAGVGVGTTAEAGASEGAGWPGSGNPAGMSAAGADGTSMLTGQHREMMIPGERLDFLQQRGDGCALGRGA